jgi:hypothetical protein
MRNTLVFIIKCAARAHVFLRKRHLWSPLLTNTRLARFRFVLSRSRTGSRHISANNFRYKQPALAARRAQKRKIYSRRLALARPLSSRCTKSSAKLYYNCARQTYLELPLFIYAPKRHFSRLSESGIAREYSAARC